MFKEIERVLKSDGKLVVTFNNRHMKFWRPLIESIHDAGFKLQKFDWVDQAVRSGTQGINHANTLHGDFIYTYTPTGETHTKPAELDGEEVALKALRELFSQQKRASTADIYRVLVPNLINQMAFTDANGKEIEIDSLLNKYCLFEDTGRGLNSSNGWTLRRGAKI